MRKIVKLVFLILVVTSCKQEVIPEKGHHDPNSFKASSIGKKLENPYSLKNMNMAFVNLLKSEEIDRTDSLGNNTCKNCSGYPMLLKPTHIYVKILPRDSVHYEELIQDTNIVVFDHPLDVEVSEGENAVMDNIEGNGLKYLYTKLSLN